VIVEETSFQAWIDEMTENYEGAESNEEFDEIESNFPADFKKLKDSVGKIVGEFSTETKDKLRELGKARCSAGRRAHTPDFEMGYMDALLGDNVRQQ